MTLAPRTTRAINQQCSWPAFLTLARERDGVSFLQHSAGKLSKLTESRQLMEMG